MIDEKLKKPYISKKFSKEEVYCINFYLGNADGKAGYRLKISSIKIFNHN